MARIPSVAPSAAILLALISAVAVPRTSSAQLRSFWALKVVSLEAAPGAEAVAKDLGGYLRAHGALVMDPSQVPADVRPRFARCIVRHNLPKPRRLALECYDYAGTYVGTLRAKGPRQLWSDRLMHYLYEGGPSARPLSAYRYVYLEPLRDDRHDARSYVAELLRNDKSYTVVESLETLSPEAKMDLLRCGLKPAYAFSGPILLPTMMSAVQLSGADGERVFNFVGAADWYIKESSGVRKSLSDAIRQLLRARADDLEIYADRPAAVATGGDSRR